MAMYRKPLVPDGFEIPERFELDNCIFIPLKIDHAELDYAAVMDNYDEDGNQKYPNHTLYQNKIDLGYHQKEFQKKASFTYTILNKEENECLGCLYIYPSDDKRYDAEVDMWIRGKYRADDERIKSKIREWINTLWPFNNPKLKF